MGLQRIDYTNGAPATARSDETKAADQSSTHGHTSDLRHAVRLLGRSPVFTLTSVVSLAIGIGAAATIFSLTDALLFEPTVGRAKCLGGGRYRPGQSG